jgi:prevent-host-death family protein
VAPALGESGGRRIANGMQFMDNAGNTEGSTVPMLKVPAGEFQRNIGRYQDMALTQPVGVTRNGRERTVLISADEYQRLKRRDRQVLTLSDFTEADIVALEATHAPESSKAFDHELQQ